MSLRSGSRSAQLVEWTARCRARPSGVAGRVHDAHTREQAQVVSRDAKKERRAIRAIRCGLETGEEALWDRHMCPSPRLTALLTAKFGVDEETGNARMPRDESGTITSADLTDDEIFGAIVPTCINMFSILTPLFVGVDTNIRDNKHYIPLGDESVRPYLMALVRASAAVLGTSEDVLRHLMYVPEGRGAPRCLDDQIQGLIESCAEELAPDRAHSKRSGLPFAQKDLGVLLS
jgi:hypothetical protein